MEYLPTLLKDGYKTQHIFQYPKDTTLVYSNFTPRGTRLPNVPGVISFGLQYFIKEYLQRQFQRNFFQKPKADVLHQYARRLNHYLGGDLNCDHIGKLHDLGYLPLCIKSLPEGTLVPFRVPIFTIYNTHPDFFWLTNMLETLLSNILWMPCTSATTSFLYRRVFEYFAAKTCDSNEHVKWQGHDFSFRGLSGIESACMSGAAHLLSFTGTDTIPAIDFLENNYHANVEKEVVAASVTANEHSVVCVGSAVYNSEKTFLAHLIEENPTGIFSYVSDTYDFWDNVVNVLPQLKSQIMSRTGAWICRPDSGVPEKIICGDPEATEEHVRKGAIQCLWETFGGTTNSKGYKVLDPHIGLIYGDSITRERQWTILSQLEEMGFASSNVALGIGSFTFQHVTRDTYGFAMKATYAETKSQGGLAIWKDPKTDDGIKRSAKGLLCVENKNGGLVLEEEVDWEREKEGELQTVFLNGAIGYRHTLSEIRERVEGNL